MPRKRFTNEPIAFAMRQAENGATVDEVCRKMGVTEAVRIPLHPGSTLTRRTGDQSKKGASRVVSRRSPWAALRCSPNPPPQRSNIAQASCRVSG